VLLGSPVEGIISPSEGFETLAFPVLLFLQAMRLFRCMFQDLLV
jgi:hypothetical protein